MERGQKGQSHTKRLKQYHFFFQTIYFTKSVNILLDFPFLTVSFSFEMDGCLSPCIIFYWVS